jgi:hypothetical protein
MDSTSAPNLGEKPSRIETMAAMANRVRKDLWLGAGLGQSRRQQSSAGRCDREAEVESNANRMHEAAKIEFLPATSRGDVIPQ